MIGVSSGPRLFFILITNHILYATYLIEEIT